MSDLGFEIFDQRGTFIPPSDEQAATLSEAAREKLRDVQAAYAASHLADADLKAAQDSVVSLAAELRDAEEHVRKHFPQIDAVTLIKQHIASERARYVHE